MTKPMSAKDHLQIDLQAILTATEGKIDAASAEKARVAMDQLLANDNETNRNRLIAAVDELLIIGDAGALDKKAIQSMLGFLESLKTYLDQSILKKVYDIHNELREEQRKKIDRKMDDLREAQNRGFRR